MNLGELNCVVCLASCNAGLNYNNGTTEKSNTGECENTKLWKTFLTLFDTNHERWRDIGECFGDRNITPFCGHCNQLVRALVIPIQGQQLISDTSIWEKTQKVVEATLIKGMIESESGTENIHSNILCIPSVITCVDTNSSLEMIKNRIAHLRHSKLQQFLPIVLIRDCRDLSTTLKYLTPRTGASTSEVQHEPTESSVTIKLEQDEEPCPEFGLKRTQDAEVNIQFKEIKTEKSTEEESIVEENCLFAEHTFKVPTGNIANDDGAKYYFYKSTNLGKKMRKGRRDVKIPSGALPVVIKLDSIVCDLCDSKPFQRNSNLVRHIQKIHRRPVARLLNPVMPNLSKVVATKVKPQTKTNDGELEYGGWKITQNDAGAFSCVCGVNDGDLYVIKTHIKTEHLADRNPDQFPVKGGGEKASSLGNGKYVYGGDWVFQKIEDDKFECFTCLVQKPTKKAMVQHLKTKHTPAACRFYCKQCNVGFISKSYFIKHGKRHKKQRWWKVQKDTYIYDKKFEFKRCEEGFRCNTCSLLLKRLVFMTKHIRDVHSNPELATCSKCGKAFTTRGGFLKHMRKEVCGKSECRVLSSDRRRLIYRDKFEIEIFSELDNESNLRYRCLTCRQERNSRWGVFRHIRMRHCEDKQ